MMYGGAIFIASCFLFSIFISVSYGCPKGYYGSPCTPCPVNTYKDFSGNAASCTTCPSYSGHQKIGSNTIYDCRCFTGYNGRPEFGIPCQIRRCLAPYVPSDGVIMGVCNNYYTSVCVMRCNEGYEAIGSRERYCDVHANDVMMWTGSPLECVVITCPLMVVPNADPPTGFCTTQDLVYKTRCTFSCRRGYRLMGSKERVCELDKSWSGGSTSCDAIQCPKLPPVQAGVSLVPSTCATGPVIANMLCEYRCPSGYSITGSSTVIICQLDGTWSTSVPTCRDYQPPSLTCPGPNLQTNVMKGKATARVLWTIQVTDNSVDVNPNAVIVVRSNHEPGQELPIGQTMIHVTATDEAGNMAECSFDIEVKDTEPPTCSFCPADIVKEETTSTVIVNWQEPSCSDNSGLPVSITSNKQNGAMFSVPGSSHVQYLVTDNSWNTNRNCSFKITLKVKTCHRFPPPRNGALACTPDDMCAVLCKKGTDFEFNPPLLYYCSAEKWESWTLPWQSYESKVPWPNCSDKANRSWLKMNGMSNYFYGSDDGGDAHDPSVQEDIKKKFHSSLTSPFVPPPFCLFRPTCTKDSITVSPGVIG